MGTIFICDMLDLQNGPGCTCPKGQGRIQDGGGQKPRRVGKKKTPPPSLKIVSSKFPPLVLVPGYATASEWSPLLVRDAFEKKLLNQPTATARYSPVFFFTGKHETTYADTQDPRYASPYI